MTDPRGPGATTTTGTSGTSGGSGGSRAKRGGATRDGAESFAHSEGFGTSEASGGSGNSSGGGREGRDLFTADEWACLGDRLGLSGRELEILKHFFDGDTEARAAYLLGVEYSTVHTHVQRLYAKLGVADQRELLVRVFAAHLSPE